MTTTGLFLPVFAILLLCGIATSTASAQDSNTSQSSVAASTVKRAATSEITVAGTIQEVSSEHILGRPAGLHLLVNSPQGVLDASVGPNLSQDVRQTLSTGQQVQVVGVVRTINGHSYLLARQLDVDGRQITIRNENGFLTQNHSRAGNRPQTSQSELNGGIR